MTIAAVVAATFGVGMARAEDWPTRPVTWVVPFAAGGVTDTTARKIAVVLADKLGQSVIVENKPGAGGIVGTEGVAVAKPDGYTVLYASGGPMAILPNLKKGKLSYDPVKDFAHVQGITSSSQLIVASPNAPFNTLPELIAYAKANPGKVNFGSPGIGTAQHFAGELLAAAADIEMTHIPYKAGTSQMVDLMSGVIDLSFDYTSVIKPYSDAGKMKVIGATGPERLPSFPDAMTVVEAGLPDAVNVGWTSVALPAGTPQEIVDKLSGALQASMADPSVVEYFAINAQTPITDKGPKDMTQFVVEENEKFARIVTAAGLAE
ncbi:tripartite tricarboxylate transporter substrate binding protein [Tianweitania sp. Rool2]|uniref:Tripartite tricarboxylate transporter substrate binding protein n=2 Tax=Oryzicola mucosus TaxID=2767425 RepID=A0A8J6Q3R1_9HYPH|nr:tripartite tricarboxylate transporter substrate binding protein [Oryzicola mucosus]